MFWQGHCISRTKTRLIGVLANFNQKEIKNMETINPDDLNNIFLTADTHLGHENIIKYCDRPFESVEEMDRVLISNWNEIVGADDIVYHLGDFTLGGFIEAKQYFRQLNGHIKVLANTWHHDKRWIQEVKWLPAADIIGVLDISMGFGSTRYYNPIEILPPMVVLEIEGMGEWPLAVTLCHYPLMAWDRKNYGSWHLYAHTHKSDNSEEFRLNIGVDCMNYYPISLGNVLTCMYEKGW